MVLRFFVFVFVYSGAAPFGSRTATVFCFLSCVCSPAVQAGGPVSKRGQETEQGLKETGGGGSFRPGTACAGNFFIMEKHGTPLLKKPPCRLLHETKPDRASRGAKRAAPAGRKPRGGIAPRVCRVFSSARGRTRKKYRRTGCGKSAQRRLSEWSVRPAAGALEPPRSGRTPGPASKKGRFKWPSDAAACAARRARAAGNLTPLLLPRHERPPWQGCRDKSARRPSRRRKL